MDMPLMCVCGGLICVPIAFLAILGVSWAVKRVKRRCSHCGGTGEVVSRPSRLMGATYLDTGSGDERLEICPHCNIEGI